MKRYLHVALIVVLLLLMANLLIGIGVFHESLGLIMGLLVLVHLVQNRTWWQSLFKGKYNVQRFVLVLLNVALAIGIVITMISGIRMSHYVIPNTIFFEQMGTIRLIHHYAVYWVFIICAAHVGLHVPVITGRWPVLKRALQSQNIWLQGIVALICLYGAYAFWYESLFMYLTFISDFAYFDFDQPVLLFLFNYFSIFILVAAIFYRLFGVRRNG